ncbi:MAG: 16S rRNA (cytosine(1402)-N(4))-methyltransferase RsmH, partial [Clostridia bacterium]
MAFHHQPVLLSEVLEWLDPVPGGIYVDGTLGGGGHSEAILQKMEGQGHLYGIDRDPEAIVAATERLGTYAAFTAITGNFHDVKTLLHAQNVSRLDGMLLDLGVSSHQLDTADRGFSYHADAPLDMRMDPTQTLTAATLVNTLDAQALTQILREYGEEKWAARIAQILLEHRAKSPLKTTGDLVHAIDAAIPKRVRSKDEGHPARRSFQALRIAVNDELGPLKQALEDAVSLLKPGGKLCVITFHSLEDRIVKQT